MYYPGWGFNKYTVPMSTNVSCIMNTKRLPLKFHKIKTNCNGDSQAIRITGEQFRINM